MTAIISRRGRKNKSNVWGITLTVVQKTKTCRLVNKSFPQIDFLLSLLHEKTEQIQRVYKFRYDGSRHFH